MFAARLACLAATGVLVLGFPLGSEARTSIPKSYVPEKTRNIVGGRKVLVVVPQTSITGTFAPAYVGPGLAAALIQQRLTEVRSYDAAMLVAPLVAALDGYDFDGRLYSGLLPTIESSPWLRGQDLELTHLGLDHDIEQKLDESNTRQMLLLRGTYYVDFHDQRLIVELQATLLVRQIPKGKYSHARLERDYIPYQQVFRNIFYLPDSHGLKPQENVARWAADGGKLARRALDSGIGRVHAMFAANIDADKKTVEQWRRRGERKTVERFGVLGWVVEDEGDALVYVEARSGALNYIETLRAD